MVPLVQDTTRRMAITGVCTHTLCTAGMGRLADHGRISAFINECSVAEKYQRNTCSDKDVKNYSERTNYRIDHSGSQKEACKEQKGSPGDVFAI
jgi:hypothetical protein